MKKNFSLYGLPETVEFCKSCVISNQRPNSVIEFKNSNNQKDGIKFKNQICEACNYNKIKNDINWSQREQELIKLLDKYRKKSGYDCVVPGSGGKDSDYTAHILKYKYNMNPLTVTWAPHLYTDIGWKNFTNWMHIGGLDNILFTLMENFIDYNSTIIQEFNTPFSTIYNWSKNYSPKIAEKFNIPLVIYGENQAEYGNNIDENYNPIMNLEFFSDNDINPTFGGVKMDEIIKNYNFKFNDFEPYLPLDKKNIKSKKIKVFYLGYFLKWDPQECFYYASKNTGFTSNTERTEGSYSKYSSIDDKIDPFIYTTYIKFGISRATYDAAQEVEMIKLQETKKFP